MKLYGAIDLYSNNNVTVLIDELDQVVYPQRSVIDRPAALGGLSGSARLTAWWTKDIKFIWPTQRRFNNTKGSSTPTISIQAADTIQTVGCNKSLRGKR